MDGYSAVSDKCVKCPNNAISCSATNVVVSCANNYAKSGDSTECIPCLVGTYKCAAPVAT